MYYEMPVRVYEEENCVLNHSGQLGALGKKALIVTGRHSAKVNGSLKDVTDALEKEGVKYAVFDEIEENPSVETIMNGRERGIAENADFVIGIGGGSPLDAAKAIAFMIYHREKDASYLYEDDGNSEALPVAAVPTTCGTGSEVTSISVLTRREKETKASIPHHIFPEIALIDAVYLRNASQKIIRNTAVDALCHLCESWINVKANDFSRMFVSAGLKIWRRSRDVLLGKKEAEKEDLRNLMRASTLAGMAISHTGTSLAHGLSYAVTYETGMPHGKAAGYFLPGFLRESDDENVAYLMRESGFRSIEDLREFYGIVCREAVISPEILEKTVQSLLKNPAKLKSFPYPANEAVLRRIAGI